MQTKKIQVEKGIKNSGLGSHHVQWGSEIWTSLYFKWLKRGWVANGPDFEWDLKSGSLTIWYPDKRQLVCQKLFEIRTKMSRLRIARFLNGWDHSFRQWLLSSPFFSNGKPVFVLKLFSLALQKQTDWSGKVTSNLWEMVRFQIAIKFGMGILDSKFRRITRPRFATRKKTRYSAITRVRISSRIRG